MVRNSRRRAEHPDGKMKTNLLTKIVSTPRTLLPADSFGAEPDDYRVVTELSAATRKLFAGSLAIRVVTAGSTNACEQELVALGNSYYDVERFGVHFVASPRHADMLMVTGPVSRNMREALVQTYEAMPEPRLVVAVGDDAIDGGLFRGSYAVLDGVKTVIPVHYEIPGAPPSPRQILSALLAILRGGKTPARHDGTSHE
jgi:Ni,Fe-hydrogenase III small subunit